MTTLYLPEPPSANRWWRKFHNRIVLSDAARHYKLLVRSEAMRASGKLAVTYPSGNLSVVLTWRRKRKAGDLDKRLGVLLDGLQGTVYANDSQITSILATRVDDPLNPGVTVSIEPTHI